MKEPTPAQTEQYEHLRDVGWEFCCWEDDDIIMQLWQQTTMESRSLISEVLITPSGTVIKTDKP